MGVYNLVLVITHGEESPALIQLTNYGCTPDRTLTLAPPTTLTLTRLAEDAGSLVSVRAPDGTLTLHCIVQRSLNPVLT